jgi:uncharacterized membrane protein YccC
MAAASAPDPSTSHLDAVRMAVAATTSVLIAHALRMPEPYWAPMTTIVVVQSSLFESWNASRSYFLGTALGAVAGGTIAFLPGPGTWLFCVAVLGIGLLSAVLGLDRASYRFTCITLAIVILVPHTASHAWRMAAHRFLEASTGIAIGLAFTASWPERRFKRTADVDTLEGQSTRRKENMS